MLAWVTLGMGKTELVYHSNNLKKSFFGFLFFFLLYFFPYPHHLQSLSLRANFDFLFLSLGNSLNFMV